ncbi:kinase-like protein, partial [Aureobasidium melanogenum]
MGVPPGSQAAPLPSNLPFRLVSKTIGSGAYASIRKAVPKDKPKPVIAVKFINKEHAFRVGRLRPKQIELEISLHRQVSGHANIIRFLSHGDDQSWIWIAMELAEGGDLFDKIEADEGVGEDIAHFYFKQLVNAISWCHGKGVAHRDIKPENMLLTANGDLKLADFGLATNFLNLKTGDTKMCGLVCGSPPYIAPEIIQVGHANQKRKHGEDKFGYCPNISDIWSCAIVLFVLLVGNTPWDQPEPRKSEEFYHFCETQGRPEDELWEKIPSEALSLLRGMLKVDVLERFKLDDIRIHSWYTRPNKFMNSKGTVSDSISLATNMIERLHIDFTTVPDSSQSQEQPKQVESQPAPALISTQPVTPAFDQPFDWEAPPRLAGLTASQPVTAHDSSRVAITHDLIAAQLSQEPHMTQFSQNHSVPLSLTQNARRFRDIVPAQSLARFYSYQALPQLLGTVRSALHTLNVPIHAATAANDKAKQAYIRIRMSDGRKQGLSGNVVLESITEDGLVEVRFVKAKGDPLEWRRLFKRVAVLCRDAILMPRE